ncbi:AraC family transcriptional regulator [Arenibaculum pallidiluteum]|uniref:AraC family transcriptional regulator n=1 Tax=Arenibaculum pallidiluteum TaxID=2812559 RepID=UPI001F1D630C|nr:AraC family transcriptional regulator [Arenibaculum pallidiluteum]
MNDHQVRFALPGLGDGDRARFWRARRHHGLEGLTATFRRHRYVPHMHETYAIGVILAGCETYDLRGERRYAQAGELCFVNPGEVHDGEPLGDGYSCRMSYPAAALLAEITSDARGGRPVATPYFAATNVRDPAAFEAFVAAHRRLEEDPEPLAGDEAMVRAYALILARHGGEAPPDQARPAGGAVDRVREYLDEQYAEPIELATLAEIAGLTRHHLIRLFKRRTGLTPHAYLTDCRVRAARRRLVAGETPAEVAVACGFFDQSHLTRAFKARTGISPGAFRAG